jgi:hypothetical protein
MKMAILMAVISHLFTTTAVPPYGHARVKNICFGE